MAIMPKMIAKRKSAGRPSYVSCSSLTAHCTLLFSAQQGQVAQPAGHARQGQQGLDSSVVRKMQGQEGPPGEEDATGSSEGLQNAKARVHYPTVTLWCTCAWHHYPCFVGFRRVPCHSQHEELKNESKPQGAGPEEACEQPPHLRRAKRRATEMERRRERRRQMGGQGRGGRRGDKGRQGR